MDPERMKKTQEQRKERRRGDGERVGGGRGGEKYPGRGGERVRKREIETESEKGEQIPRESAERGA
jgi:hypothetical protein